MSVEELVYKLRTHSDQYQTMVEAADKLEELAAENERLKEDRARFPDRPDDIGRMIEAHIGNLKAGKKSAEALADKAFDRAFRAEAALAERDKEIAELREALEPFSRLASVLCVGDADDAIVIGVSAGDLRRLVNACRVREGGKSETCPECGGKGDAQPVASTNLA